MLEKSITKKERKSLMKQTGTRSRLYKSKGEESEEITKHVSRRYLVETPMSRSSSSNKKTLKACLKNHLNSISKMLVFLNTAGIYSPVSFGVTLTHLDSSDVGSHHEMPMAPFPAPT